MAGVTDAGIKKKEAQIIYCHDGVEVWVRVWPETLKDIQRFGELSGRLSIYFLRRLARNVANKVGLYGPLPKRHDQGRRSTPESQLCD